MLRQKSLLPNTVLFWGGPIHGQIKFVDRHRILVPVMKEVNLMSFMAHSTDDLHYDIAEYNSQVYWWRWKCQEKESVVMTLGYFTDVSVLEVEAIMQFLGTLWGDRSNCGEWECKRCEPGLR